MRIRLQRTWFQIVFSTKNNFSYSYRRYYLTVLRRTQFREQEQPVASPFLDEVPKENIDELDEECIYKFPDGVTHATLSPIQKIMEEVEIRSRFRFREIPKYLSSEDWKALLELGSRAERENFYKFLYWKEKTRELKKKKRREQKLLREVDERETIEADDTKNLRTNQIFNFTFLKHFHRRNASLQVMKSVMFGPHIVVDCSYESYMRDSELMSCARQLAMLRKANMTSRHPFDVVHCNVNVEGKLIEMLREKHVPDCLDPANIFHHSEKDFVDLFPREKLVYLSPHSDTELETYDHDSIYVVGAMVDHYPKPGLSTDKANISGIRSVKFPLERYINWCRGTKSLMLFQAVNIMHDLKEGKSWDEIFQKHIRFEKTKFAGPLWKEYPTLDPLSLKHINQLHFAEHRIKHDLKIK